MIPPNLGVNLKLESYMVAYQFAQEILPQGLIWVMRSITDFGACIIGAQDQQIWLHFLSVKDDQKIGNLNNFFE